MKCDDWKQKHGWTFNCLFVKCLIACLCLPAPAPSQVSLFGVVNYLCTAFLILVNSNSPSSPSTLHPLPFHSSSPPLPLLIPFSPTPLLPSPSSPSPLLFHRCHLHTTPFTCRRPTTFRTRLCGGPSLQRWWLCSLWVCSILTGLGTWASLTSTTATHGTPLSWCPLHFSECLGCVWEITMPKSPFVHGLCIAYGLSVHQVSLHICTIHEKCSQHIRTYYVLMYMYVHVYLCILCVCECV